VKTNGKANGNHQSACEEWNTKDEDDDFDKALDKSGNPCVKRRRIGRTTQTKNMPSYRRIGLSPS
jgi:hypothetical protein